jgi:hypothetical protein
MEHSVGHVSCEPTAAETGSLLLLTVNCSFLKSDPREIKHSCVDLKCVSAAALAQEWCEEHGIPPDPGRGRPGVPETTFLCLLRTVTASARVPAAGCHCASTFRDGPTLHLTISRAVSLPSLSSDDTKPTFSSPKCQLNCY